MRVLFLLSLLFLAVTAQQPYANRVDIFQVPSTIPSSGTYTAVIEWESNIRDTLNLHLDLSDITQSYAYDGGAFAQVQGPGAGFITMILPLIGTLNVGDRYQLHTYMTTLTNSTLYGSGNDWQHTAFDGYFPVTVSSAQLPTTMSLLSVPSTIPNQGYFVADVFWSSSIPQYTLLHMDLGDVTRNYAYNGGAMVNVTSPGSGIVKMNMSIINPTTAGAPLSIGDTYDIHLYLATPGNNTQYSTPTANNDWAHNSFERYYTAMVANAASLANSLTILNPPTMIPPTGNFTVQCAWSTPYAGVMNLHVDVSDITQSYAYDGGNMVQVIGPGSGTIPITVTITTTAAAIDKMQLHTYMLDEITSQEYLTNAGNNDWAHTLFDAYYPVSQGYAVVIPYPNMVSIYQPPSTIPNSGIISAVIEWSSNLATSTTIHMDLSDITQSYAWDGGVSITVPSPGSGFVTLSLPIIGQLNTGDAYQLHVYIASYANTTLYGAGNDWQHSSYDLYQPVVVSSAPLANYMQLLNVPTTVPAAGTVQLEVFYTSNLPNATFLHVDFSDVTANWAYETGSSVMVPSPGSGTVTISVTWPASLNLKIGDTYNLHGYMTSLANNTLYGVGNDWAHASYDSYNTVQIANAATFPISLTPINPPATIPNQGNFTVQYAWSCNYTGEINLHVDLSDTSANWLFEGGSTVQVTSPGAGVATFFISTGTNVLPLGDVFQLHAYVAPTSVGLQYGIGNDWQHTIYDGFTTVSAVLPSNGKLTNTVTFLSPPVIIPPTGSFTVTVAYTTNITTGVNVHVDMSDVTQSWAYETGSMAMMTATSGTVTLTLTLPTGVTLNTGDFYYLQVYMTSTVASNAHGGNGSDWQIPLINAFTQVTVSSKPLVNSMIIVNPPQTIANTGTETFMVQWTSPYSGALNLHCDISDVTQNYLYEGGSMNQVIGPGSGILAFQVALGSVNVKLGDNYTVHLYMTSAANSSRVGGTSNDWTATAYDGFYAIQAAVATSFKNSFTIINPPSQVPGNGNSFTVQCAWSTSYTGPINLHVDLSDITQNYAYDGGAASQTVEGPGSGIITVVVPLTANMPYSDSYQIHTYMTTQANSTIYGPENDWQHTIYDGYYPVGEYGSGGSSSSSSKSLSGGAIAGIVIGCVVGVALLAVLCFFFVLSGSRSSKSSKMDDDRVSGKHARHEDEQSQVSSADVEMGETGDHSNA